MAIVPGFGDLQNQPGLAPRLARQEPLKNGRFFGLFQSNSKVVRIGSSGIIISKGSNFVEHAWKLVTSSAMQVQAFTVPSDFPQDSLAFSKGWGILTSHEGD